MMKILTSILKNILAGVFFMACVFHLYAAEICVQDDFGERIHLKVHPSGLLTGYSEFNEVVTGTAFGSYKRLSDTEVMIGGDVNNDCTSGLFPGKFNAILNVETMTGQANGLVFICDGTTVPFSSPLYPCDNSDEKPANWSAFFETGKRNRKFKKKE